jgi:U3 small nucleolar RNA-associated protein MPP10
LISFSAIRQENQGFTRIQQFVKSLAGDMARQPRETRAQAILRQHTPLPEQPSAHLQMQGLLDAANKLTPTPLSGLHIEGMEAEQIWNQLELRAKGVCELVDLVFDGEYPKDDEGDDQDEGDEEEDGEEDDEMMLESDEDDDEFMPSDEPEESSQGSDLGEHIAPLNGEPAPKAKLPIALLQSWITHQSDQETPSNPPPQQSKKAKGKGNRHQTLDDEFFSISEFNREIESAEAKKTSRGRLSGKGEDSDEEGSLDLFKEVDDGMDEEEDEDEDDRSEFFLI